MAITNLPKSITVDGHAFVMNEYNGTYNGTYGHRFYPACDGCRPPEPDSASYRAAKAALKQFVKETAGAFKFGVLVTTLEDLWEDIFADASGLNAATHLRNTIVKYRVELGKALGVTLSVIPVENTSVISFKKVTA